MKKLLLILTLFLIGFVQHISAQDLSAFYQPDSKNSTYKFDKKLGYTLPPSGKLKFKGVNDETIDIKFTFTIDEKFEEESHFKIKVGEILYYIPLDDRASIELNGKHQENYSSIVFQNYLANAKNKTKSTFYVTLRIGKNYARAFHEAEMQSQDLSSKLPITNRNIEVEVESKGTSTIKVEVGKDHLIALSSFAENGLKIRKSANLSASQIGSIAFKDQAFVLENLDNELTEIERTCDTKGSLKVGDLSSRMVKILYKDKIGYAYGGYLLPLFKKGSSDTEIKSSFQGWQSGELNMIEVFHHKKRAYRTAMINFHSGLLSTGDPSQQKFVLTQLFPKAFTLDKINTFLQTNKLHTFEVNNGNYTEYFTVKVTKNKLTKVSYKEIRKGFFEELKKQTKGYVVASSLNMRETNNPKSTVITKIPMSASVKILDTSADFLMLGGIRGKMVKVEYKGKKGYVFDAYLSPIQPFAGANGKTVSTDVSTKTFVKIRKKRGTNVWEHHQNYSSNKVIVPARDLFQVLKTFRNIYSPINDISFKWSEQLKDYEIISKSPKIEASTSEGYWSIYLEDDYTPYMTISKLNEYLYIVKINNNEGPGC